MHRIGLALSGGGFRASLYHLGLVRFLRDAGILPHVTHITSVSGGSIFSAHLVQNWERYNGSPNDFDAAASEFLSFVRLDVRNRVTRRALLATCLLFPARLLGLSTRRLTRTGLLHYHYKRYLCGDTSLFALPEKPKLHILATNLSEGCLCSFNRDGLLMVRGNPADGIRLDRIHVGLATVAMAVTASSAFPSFFPPLELTGADVGVSVGGFGRQAYTDGGVFDNLGVRMFRCLERPLLTDTALCRADFFDFPAVLQALHQAGDSGEETPLHRLAQILATPWTQPAPLLLTNAGAPSGVEVLPPTTAAGNGDDEGLILSRLEDVLRRFQLQHDPLFAGLKLVDPEAESLLHASLRGDRVLGIADQFWLNRHLFNTAFHQATGQDCFRRLHSGLDGVLVSDVGKPIEVQGRRRAGGVIRTSLRASSILMDRVWQLEKETFHNAPGFVFAPITEVVDLSEDPTALHPEVQRQTAGIRTDLDRFSPLEVRSLVQHGYCVGRKACRAHPAVFGAELPGNPPWDPIAASRGVVPPAKHRAGLPRDQGADTADARTLRASAYLRIWSTFLDYRDWTSYVFVPLLIPIFVLLPLFIVKTYERSHRINQIVESLAQGSRDLEYMTRLLEYGPDERQVGEYAEEVGKLDKPDFSAVEILQDSYIFDLRHWRSSASRKNDPNSRIHHYRRLKVAKKPQKTGDQIVRWQLLTMDPQSVITFPRQRVQPTLRKSYDATVPREKLCQWEVSFDLHRVPANDFVDLLVEYRSSGLFLDRQENSTTIPLRIAADTAELTMWILMPQGKEYADFHIIRHETKSPEKVERVRVVTEYLATDYTILAFKLLSLKAGYTYEVNWSYKSSG
jgi:predicted acylesterase/phospholipase RssA